MNTPLDIAFLGLGTMGAPMARHLAAARHRVTGWNRTPARAQGWADHCRTLGLEVNVAPSAGDAVAGAQVVLSCLGNDDDLADVMLGDDGALAAMQAGALFVDHTTVSPDIARRLAAEADTLGLLALDAPVSGGQAGAENGKLSIMCGGSVVAMDAARPVMEAYALRMVHIGPPGAGQGAKAVNQVCIAGVLAGLSEGLRLAEASGLDLDAVFEAISGGAAQSWQMDNRWKTMAADEFDFGFAIDWMRKDLAIALAEAREYGLDLPVTAQVDGFYAEVQAMGGGRQDTSALVRHLGNGGEA
ncbi:NAD(P)-dependent oxidoreductase [Altererythrobacter sp. KTW20L]|uniref:NAD(P)-dependent oxidoreductase n=1 Tax=Altererythrobacter sp. KTW20L TaxID=2942210 RepID=UPI0020BD5AD8|nr:NAD(P)-dependent oxidoreductase [Altererythrobacter sp. KTW20L]MCL6250994.1 NAD(P)-dependent oxidoreductase [Altererythrobacter sp. KTW20L]